MFMGLQKCLEVLYGSHLGTKVKLAPQCLLVTHVSVLYKMHSVTVDPQIECEKEKNL